MLLIHPPTKFGPLMNHHLDLNNQIFQISVLDKSNNFFKKIVNRITFSLFPRVDSTSPAWISQVTVSMMIETAKIKTKAVSSKIDFV